MGNKSININGIAHVALSVSNIKVSKRFYKEFLPFIGLKLIHESNKSCYHVGGKTAVLIQQISKNQRSINFSQNNVGLHHFCFRARSKKDVDKIGDKLISMKADIVRGPVSGNWVTGYYYILFEDPDKIRIEINYVPNKGVFENNVVFNPGDDY